MRKTKSRPLQYTPSPAQLQSWGHTTKLSTYDSLARISSEFPFPFLRHHHISPLMALTLSSPTSCPLSWVGEIYVGRKKGSLVYESLNLESSEISAFPSPEDKSGWPRENFLPHVACQEEINTVDATDFCGEKANNEKSAGIFAVDDDIVSHGEKIMQEKVRSIKGVLLSDTIQGSESLEMVNFGGARAALKVRKRPSKLVVPAYSAEMEFGEMCRKLTNTEFEVEGRNFVLASKKGRRTTGMEDGYGVMLDILGDPKQALFAVIDGHGGHAAADYVAENLGRNIVKYIGEEDRLEQAIRRGFLVTDKEFLSQGVSSGACAASVLLKEGELHVANVGDCRVVLSRKGLAAALTNEHRLSREDERRRIESSGGFVNYCNGVWRVQGTLAVSRAIGDLHLKQWIISEPEIKKLPLTSDCQFLIMASDGLWDKVDDQEAVDVVLREKNMLMSCKKLADMSCSRGNMDDITVMVINLQNFV